MRPLHRHVKADPYVWPHDGPPDASNTALIVIDMQCDFCDPGGYLDYQGYDCSSTRKVIPNISKLLTTCREWEFPIFFTRESHRASLSDLPSRELFRSRNNKTGLGIGDRGPKWRFLVRGEPGCDIIQELCPVRGEDIVDKPGKGAFTNTDLELLLSNKGIRNLILCGVTTDVGVHTTMREANDRGYDCLLVADCCASGDERLHAAAIEMVKAEGGVFGAVASLVHVQAALSLGASDCAHEKY